MSEHASTTAQGSGEHGGETLHWAAYTVLERTGNRPQDADSQANRESFDALVARLAERGMTVRGVYDVSGMRESADLMVWLTGPDPEELQAAVRELRREPLLAGTRQSWNAMGVHRDAEFTRNHSPAFARGQEAQKWVCVYPFVRSYEWYYMNAERRNEMLKNHGMKAREYPQVLANTIACFGLNDFEWLLALEAPELVDLVDIMRHFRNTEARLHVREETPFYTGRRITTEEIAEVLD
ncbi:hydrogen peroxide-dependent heme synthase [Kocuria sp.]|uniref:hydrogen peroxide-dependent heme synthase n=1 Tax=Kocuria sp. TaxID=1871328 RepID=UPI0026DABB47|nr:hydrogen peroxide-dependent heme synthase [Kocuria sp.]MDO4918881.1 chlorite dismutase family protein [Kocuria sp.]